MKRTVRIEPVKSLPSVAKTVKITEPSLDTSWSHIRSRTPADTTSWSRARSRTPVDTSWSRPRSKTPVDTSSYLSASRMRSAVSMSSLDTLHLDSDLCLGAGRRSRSRERSEVRHLADKAARKLEVIFSG